MNSGASSRRFMWPAMAVGIGIAFASVPASSKQPEAAATILTEDSRGMVAARVGTPIEIRLRAQPGTGFSWVPKASASLVKEMKPAKSSRARPGGWQTQRFSFVANRPGSYRLSFSYDQPWRGGTKGARTKGFLIIAR